LTEDDERTRAIASASLNRMGGRAVPRLIEALRDVNPRLRAQAARALARSGRPEVLPELHALLDDPHPFVRETAAEVLENLDE
jgi:HEAT repeat protein